MSFGTYLRYKAWKLYHDAPREAKRPTTLIGLYLGIFGGTIILYFLTGFRYWYWVSASAAALCILLIIWLDYRNTPWRAWQLEKYKREVLKSSTKTTS